jgi:hypothetical protein
MTDTETKTVDPPASSPMEVEEGEITEPEKVEQKEEPAPLKRKRTPKEKAPETMDSEKMAGLIAAAVKAELAALKEAQPAQEETVVPPKKKAKISKAPTPKGRPAKPSGKSTTRSLKINTTTKKPAAVRGGATSSKKLAGNATAKPRGANVAKKLPAKTQVAKSVKAITKPSAKAARISTNNTDSGPKPRTSLGAPHQVTPHQQKLNALYSSIFS